MIQLFQQAIFELVRDIQKIDTQILGLFVIFICIILIIQITKSYHTYILFPKVQEGFEDSQKTADEEKKAKRKKELEDIQKMIETDNKMFNEYIESINTNVNQTREMIIPEDDNDKGVHNVEKLNLLSRLFCNKQRVKVLVKYAEIMSNIKKVLTNKDKKTVETLYTNLADFEELKNSDSFIEKYNTIQEQDNMANRLQFILEELTPDTLRQTNYLIDCNDNGLVSDIGSSINNMF